MSENDVVVIEQVAFDTVQSSMIVCDVIPNQNRNIFLEKAEKRVVLHLMDYKCWRIKGL